MDVKDKDPSAGDNPISTALEQVGSLPSPSTVLRYPNVTILLCWYTVMVTQQLVQLEWHNCARCSAPIFI